MDRFLTGAFSIDISVSKMQHSTYKRLKRLENNFEDAPWTISKLEWFEIEPGSGNSSECGYPDSADPEMDPAWHHNLLRRLEGLQQY